MKIAEILHVSSDEKTILPKSPTRVGIHSELALSLDEETNLPKAQKILHCPPNGAMLGSDYIVRALLILKEQFTDIGGLVDTILFQKDLSHEIN